MRANGFFTVQRDPINLAITISRYSFQQSSPVQLTESGVGIGGDNVLINWQSEVGKNYQVQYTEDLNSDSWINIGSVITGTGESHTTSRVKTADKTFMRVIEVN